MKNLIATIVALVIILSSNGYIYAFRTVITHTAVSVLHTASTATVAANNARNYLMLQNDHATQKVWCSVGGTAVLNTGFRINAAGGTVTFDTAVPVAAITCLAETGTTIILVTEGRGN